LRWATYCSSGDGLDHAALVEENLLFALPADTTLLGLLQDGALTDAAERARREPFEVVPLVGAQLRPPVPHAPSVRDFMAFENHVVTSMAALGETVDPVWYDQPAFYFSNPAALIGSGEDVHIAPGSVQWDFELEVAAVIGTAGRDLDPATAEKHIAGYCVLCDWSARDLQAAEMRVGLGPVKGKDTATSLGPVLVTPDELRPYRAGNGYDLAMTASVNGRHYSRGNWADLYWSFGQMLAYASRGTSLRPGDIIGSGTVGSGCILELSRSHGSGAYPWLQPGDEVRLEVAKLGILVGNVTAGRDRIPLRSEGEQM